MTYISPKALNQPLPDQARCTICHEQKPFDQLSHFYGKIGRCKTCNSQKTREWYQQNRDKAITRMKDYNRRSNLLAPLSDKPRGRPRQPNENGDWPCSLCHQFKPRSEFFLYTKSRHGLSSRCKQCHWERLKQKAKKLRTNNLNQIKCACCKRWLELHCFAKDKQKANQKSSYCRTCSNQKSAQFRYAKKIAQLTADERTAS